MGRQSKGLNHHAVGHLAVHLYTLRRRGKGPPRIVEGNVSSCQLPGAWAASPDGSMGPLGAAGHAGLCLHLPSVGKASRWPAGGGDPAHRASCSSVAVALAQVCRVAWSQVWSQTSGRSLPASRSASQNPQSAGSPLEDRPQASLHQTQGIWGGGRQLLHLRSCWRRGGHLPRKAQRERCPRAAGSGVGLGGAPESDRVGSSGPAMPPTGCVTLDKSLHLSVPPCAHL